MAVDKRTKNTNPVERNRVYTIAQFCEATGVGRTGLRHAERRGLKTFRSGGRKFISGEAWVRFLEQGTDSDTAT